MSSTSPSRTGGFLTRTAVKLQMSDQANPGTEAIQSALPIFVPDPNSAVAASDFVTATGTNWTITIVENVAGAVGATVHTATVLASNNIIWVALDPGVFTIGNVYRVTITDNGGNVMDVWDFELYSQDISTGAANIADINNSIRRIAGLLGYRQKVTYADYIYGVPRQTTIELQDAAGATLATYRRTLTMNEAKEVTGETMAALDTNVL